MTRRRVKAIPVTPAFTGVIDTRHAPAVFKRIVQVATGAFVLFFAATVHDPRTAPVATAVRRAPDCLVALMR